MYIRRKKTFSAFVWVLQATKEVLLNDYITGFVILLSKYNFQLVTLYQYITNILISFSSAWLLYQLFIACSDSDGVLIFIYCHTVHIQWIWKISYSPLECFSAVLSCKDWLRSYKREQLIITSANYHLSTSSWLVYTVCRHILIFSHHAQPRQLSCHATVFKWWHLSNIPL